LRGPVRWQGLERVDVNAAAQRALRLLTHLIARRTTRFHTHFGPTYR
jgi:hypothetical protein